MDEKRSYLAPAVAIALLLMLPLLYAASYYVMLNPVSLYIQHAHTYRFGGLAAERFYEPMHRLDCWLRYDRRQHIQIDYISTGYDPELEQWLIENGCLNPPPSDGN
jgi:hypothetical protein